jgi:hypothetical protein
MKTQTFLFTILLTSFFSGRILASENLVANSNSSPTVSSSSAILNTDENEATLQIESWMTDDHLWKQEKANISSENKKSKEETSVKADKEETLTIKNWMVSDNYWKFNETADKAKK